MFCERDDHTGKLVCPPSPTNCVPTTPYCEQEEGDTTTPGPVEPTTTTKRVEPTTTTKQEPPTTQSPTTSAEDCYPNCPNPNCKVWYNGCVFCERDDHTGKMVCPPSPVDCVPTTPFCEQEEDETTTPGPVGPGSTTSKHVDQTTQSPTTQSPTTQSPTTSAEDCYPNCPNPSCKIWFNGCVFCERDDHLNKMVCPPSPADCVPAVPYCEQDDSETTTPDAIGQSSTTTKGAGHTTQSPTTGSMTTSEEQQLLCDCLVEQPCVMISTGKCYGRTPASACPAGTVACQPTGSTKAPVSPTAASPTTKAPTAHPPTSPVSTTAKPASTTQSASPSTEDCSNVACQPPQGCSFGYQFVAPANGNWAGCCPAYECTKPTEVCFCPIEQPCLHSLALSCTSLAATPFGGMACPAGFSTCRVPEGNEVPTFVSMGTFLADYPSTITSSSAKLIFSLTVRNAILDNDKSIATSLLQTILVSEGSIVVLVHSADQATKAKVDAVFAACLCVNFNGKELCTCDRRDVGIGSGALDGSPDGSGVSNSAGSGGVSAGMVAGLVGALAFIVLVALLAVGRRRQEKRAAQQGANDTASTYQSAMSLNASRAAYDDAVTQAPVYDTMKLGRQDSVLLNMTGSAAYDDVAKNLEAEYGTVTASATEAVYAQVNKPAQYGGARRQSQDDAIYASAQRVQQDADEAYGQARRASVADSVYGLANDTDSVYGLAKGAGSSDALYGLAQRAETTAVADDAALYGLAKHHRSTGGDETTYGLAKGQQADRLYDLAQRQAEPADGDNYELAKRQSEEQVGPVYDLAGRPRYLPGPAYDEVAEAMAMYDSLLDTQSEGGKPVYDELRHTGGDYEDVYQVAQDLEHEYDLAGDDAGDTEYDNVCANLLASLRRDMSSEEVLRRSSFVDLKPPSIERVRSEAALSLPQLDAADDDSADDVQE